MDVFSTHAKHRPATSRLEVRPSQVGSLIFYPIKLPYPETRVIFFQGYTVVSYKNGYPSMPGKREKTRKSPHMMYINLDMCCPRHCFCFSSFLGLKENTNRFKKNTLRTSHCVRGIKLHSSASFFRKIFRAFQVESV